MGYSRRVFDQYDEDALTAAVGEISAPFKMGVSFRIAFGAVPPGAARIDFPDGPHIRLTVPDQYPSIERRDFFTNRLFAACHLLASVKYLHPEAAGSCTLWLDDVPKGPGLAFCGNATSHVLIPDSAFLESHGYRGSVEAAASAWIAWRERAAKVFWRGASTGDRNLLRVKSWRDLPRFRLCLLAAQLGRDDLLDVGLSGIVQIWDEGERRDIVAAGIVKPQVPQREFMRYRYSIDIDGNSSSWPGLFLKFAFGNAVIKIDSEMGFRQWYYDRLVPWRNFVPVTHSMRDLLETAEWAVSHEREAEQIAARGLELARSLTYEIAVAEAAETVYRYVSRE